MLNAFRIRSNFRTLVGLALLLGTACTASSTPSSTVSAISLSPAPCGVGRANSVQMVATATMPDGTKKELSSGVTWTTGNNDTATVNSTGIVVGVNTGITAVTAAYEGATGTLNCTVTP